MKTPNPREWVATGNSKGTRPIKVSLPEETLYKIPSVRVF